MENKLKLEHFAGYLPYGLKTEIKHINHFNKITISELTPIVIVDWQRGNFSLKPILRPLWDLPYSELFEKWNKDHCLKCDTYRLKLNLMGSTNIDILEYPLQFINDLYKEHFDIHGLIKQGLAIDINTLKK